MRSSLALASLLFLSGCQDDPPPPPVAPPAVPPAAAGGGPTVGRRVELSLSDATVTEVAEALARATESPVAIDPHAQELAACARLTVVSPGSVSPEQVLVLVGAALTRSGLVLERSPDGAIVRRDLDAPIPASCREAPEGEVAAEERGSDVEDRGERRTSTEVADSIRRVDATTFLMTDAAREAFMADSSTIARNVRIIPNSEGGRVRGVKLFGIRPRSLPAQLGLRNGDVLLTVAGYDVSTPERALEAYATVRRARTLEVQIERDGTPMTLTYRFVDRLPTAREQSP